ncbi:MAG: WD40 repeat domain-containing protein [Limisphaerales bacterium]
MFVVIFLLSLGQPSAGDNQDTPAERQEIARLVAQLGSAKAASREGAEDRLYTIGKPALDALHRAEVSTDPEVSRRAKSLVQAITERLSRKIYVASAEFTADGRRVLLGSAGMDSAVIWLRDLDLGKDVLFLRDHPTNTGRLTLSADGRQALIPGFQTSGMPPGTDDYSVQLWDLEKGRLLKRMEGHSTPVYSAVFSPDEKLVLSCSSERALRLWDLETGKEIRQFQGHTSNVFRAIFSPDGKRILSCGMDGTMRLWDTATAKEVRTFEPGSYVNTIAIAPDGRRALSATGTRSLNADRTITAKGITLKLWDLETGKELRSFVGHEEMITKLAVSPDGRLVLSCAWDQTVRLWDLETGKEVACFRAKEKKLSSAAFVKNGTRVMAACVDGTIEAWDVPGK